MTQLSYADNGLAPINTGPYGSYRVGNLNLIGGVSNAIPMPPMWYTTIDTNLEARNLIMRSDTISLKNTLLHIIWIQYGFRPKDFITEAIERNEWQFADPDNEVSSKIVLPRLPIYHPYDMGHIILPILI